MKIMFLDESGDHNLSVIDPCYPLFVLGGVIMEADYVRDVLTPRLAAFKHDLFGNANVVLHTADITRNRNGFERLKDAGFRAEFYARLNTLMTELEYRVVACAIRKDQHLAKYGMAALDPYLMSLDILVERFCMDIGDVASRFFPCIDEAANFATHRVIQRERCIAIVRNLIFDLRRRCALD